MGTTVKYGPAFFSWLNQMTFNACCKKTTREHRDLSLLKNEREETAAGICRNFGGQTAPDKVLGNEETRRMIVELIEQLPGPQRLCTLFYYDDEMSVKEIAAPMGTSGNTVKSRLYYSRRAIKEGVDPHSAEGIKLYGAAKELRGYCTGASLSPLAFEWWHVNGSAALSRIRDNMGQGNFEITVCRRAAP